MTTAPDTLPVLLQQSVAQRPQAPALLVPQRRALSYEHLAAHVAATATALHALGIERGDRVALVLPDGAEMAVALLAVTSSATAVPLNPAYRESEFEVLLEGLRAKALLLRAGDDSPARTVAASLGMTIIELVETAGRRAGQFSLSGQVLRSGQPDLATADDIALVLHTSGTTARSKWAPLSHRNLCVNAARVAQSLALTPADRSLGLMPLFHLHGINVSLLASLFTGGSIVYPQSLPQSEHRDAHGLAAHGDWNPWLDAHVWDAVAELGVTWYSASPTLHRALLDAHDAPLPALRCLRSSAAPLPVELQARLEHAFGCPVIQGYGMTECLHIASNPLAAGRCKPGSVGLAGGPRLAILDESGQPCPAGVVGEIALAADEGLITAYLDDPEANRAAFRHGWFHTGDLGYLDGEGYLTLTGRLKEIINRGGEKISPYEVEEVLRRHPAVADVAVFPVPHPRLGEDVAAAVVTCGDTAPSAATLHSFVASRLASFKAPSQVVFLDQLPRSATGKIRRLELAGQLGLSAAQPAHASPPPAAPHTPEVQALAEMLADFWRDLLGHQDVGLHDNFIALGGDSLLAMRLLARINQALQVNLSIQGFFAAPTLTGMIRMVLAALSAEPPAWPDQVEPSPPLAAQPPPAIDVGAQGLRPQGLRPAVARPLDFSLFFFSADGSIETEDKYQLLLASARFADENGFSGVWTPERHFHAFGGLYPNPSVLSAALAVTTRHIRIRSGSVVLPFHDPIRLAEEWAVVDNLSGGRVELACAYGWHPNDFVLAPDNYANRKELLFERITQLRQLWRGGSLTRRNGAGELVELRVYPRPLQAQPPLWLACHGDDCFTRAGEHGLNVLTSLYNTTTESIARQVRLYRQALARHGRDPGAGRVALMVHTYIADDEASARQRASAALSAYLDTFLDLSHAEVRTSEYLRAFAPLRASVIAAGADAGLSPGDREFLVSRAIDRLIRKRSLVGTVAACLQRVRDLQAIGVDEVACLIDFGISFEDTMASLYRLSRLRKQFMAEAQQSAEMHAA